MTVVGTRPEIIRLSRVMTALDAATDHRIVHTGQNYDFELNEIFYQDLQLRAPDVYLGVGGGSLGQTLGGILVKTEEVLRAPRPDAVLILGDTNSSIAAVMAKRMRIPVYHMEAGNRCFDPNVPEELNRKIVDRIADFNLVYTEHARRNLLGEGLSPRRVYLTGSPLKEVLDHYRPRIDASQVLARLGIRRGEFFLVSMHREENVDDAGNLQRLLAAIAKLAQIYGCPVIVSTHPRLRQRLPSAGSEPFEGRVRFEKPFCYSDYGQLQLNAKCVLSDSGTISEESALLSFPAVTIRSAMERPEALDTGSILLTGLHVDSILNAVAAVIEQRARGSIPPIPADYLVDNVSQRVVNLILGTARLSNEWDGIRAVDPVK
jgi:UDP-N-acetylglucosamine 2-epimerase (non-hydrolysing)